MVCIMLAGITTVGLFIFSQGVPDYGLHVDIQERVDGPSDVLYLKHSGGEPLVTGNLVLIVSVDGDKNILSDPEISEYLGKNYWEPGDVIAIDIYEKWGICLENEDCVDVFLVDRNSNKLLQRGTMPMEGMCPPLMEPGEWYFFTTVEGDDWSEEDDLKNLQDCSLDVTFTPAALGDTSQDSYLDNYGAENTFFHDLKDNPLDLTFGFEEEEFKLSGSPHNVTILMIYNMQTQPEETDLAIAGENMTELNAPDSGSKKWFMYNKTVPINISSISELEFNLHIVPSGTKDIEIDYLAVYLS